MASRPASTAQHFDAVSQRTVGPGVSMGRRRVPVVLSRVLGSCKYNYLAFVSLLFLFWFDIDSFYVCSRLLFCIPCTVITVSTLSKCGGVPRVETQKPLGKDLIRVFF